MRSLSALTRTIASAAGAVVLGLALVAPAAAVEPSIEEQSFVRQIPNQCPGFATLATFSVERRVTTFYDADGTPIRQTIVGIFPGYVENLSTGYRLPAENVRIISIDLLTGESRSTGTNVRVYLPSGGTLQLTAGLQIRDAAGNILLEGGRLDQPPTPELCAALAAG